MRTSRRGLTLVEVVVTAAIMVLVVGAAAFALSTVLTAYRDTSAQLNAYQQAVAVEKAIRSEASYATEIVMSSSPDASYSTFGFDGSSGVLTAVLSTRDSDHSGAPVGNERVTVEFDSVESIAFEVVSVAGSSRLDYGIVARDGKGVSRIEGGVILNNISSLPTSATVDAGSGVVLGLLPSAMLK